MPVHAPTSTAWLAAGLRNAATRIRTWGTPHAAADALDQLAGDLEMVVTYPPTTMPPGAPAVPAGMTTGHPELATAVRDVQQSLKRQPYEPTVDDALDVLAYRLQFGTLPLRRAPEPEGSTDGDGQCVPELCPLGTAVGHTHTGGYLTWT